MMDFIEIGNMSLDDCFRQLGMVDYTYVQLHDYMEQMIAYRTKLMQKIEELRDGGNGENMDNPTGVFENK